MFHVSSNNLSILWIGFGEKKKKNLSEHVSSFVATTTIRARQPTHMKNVLHQKNEFSLNFVREGRVENLRKILWQYQFHQLE